MAACWGVSLGLYNVKLLETKMFTRCVSAELKALTFELSFILAKSVYLFIYQNVIRYPQSF